MSALIVLSTYFYRRRLYDRNSCPKCSSCSRMTRVSTRKVSRNRLVVFLSRQNHKLSQKQLCKKNRDSLQKMLTTHIFVSNVVETRRLPIDSWKILREKKNILDQSFCHSCTKPKGLKFVVSVDVTFQACLLLWKKEKEKEKSVQFF